MEFFTQYIDEFLLENILLLMSGMFVYETLLGTLLFSSSWKTSKLLIWLENLDNLILEKYNPWGSGNNAWWNNNGDEFSKQSECQPAL